MNTNVFEGIENLTTELYKVLLPVLAVLVAICLLLFILKRRAKFGQLKLATRKKACGIIFGMILTWRGPKVVYSPINNEGSVIVWGTSGSGKTAAILRPTINSISGIATTFCIDISGDIVSTVSIKNKIVFGPSAKKSAAYSVFYPVDKIRKNKYLSPEERRAKLIEQLMKIASQIRPVMKDGEAESGVVFFNNGGHDIIAASLIAGYFKGLDFVDICVLIYNNNWNQLFRWIDDAECPEASALLGQFEGIKDEHTSGCIGSAKSAIACIASSYEVKKFLHRPKLVNGKPEPFYTPSKLETHSAFYVVDDGEDFDMYAPLTRLVVSQTMEFLQSRNMKKADHIILLTLDEYSSLSMAKETAAAAKKYRKKKVRLLVLTQSIADMDLMTRQGNTASRATIDNFPFRLILSAQDPQSQMYFAECVGKHDIYVKDSQGNTSPRPINEFWIQPSDFRMLDKHLVLIHPKGHMILGKNYFHKWTIRILFENLLDFSLFKWGVF